MHVGEHQGHSLSLDAERIAAMIYFFEIPHLTAEAKKTAKSTGQKLSQTQHALAKAKGYTSWDSMLGAAIGKDNPEALVAWFTRKHEPMRDDVDGWIYELLSEARPEQILTNAGYDTSPGFDAAVDQIWDHAVWYSHAQVQMAVWFVQHYSSADSASYSSVEGGYLWPTVDVLDALQSQFPEMPDNDVSEVAEALDRQGAWVESKWLQTREENLEMVSELDDVFLVASDVGTPLASISRRNFIASRTEGPGRMTIRFKALRSPSQDIWEERHVTFDIEPSNTHVPRVLQRWGVKNRI